MNWSEFTNFSRAEFVCRCGCGRADMNPLFMRRLQSMRSEAGFPFAVTSGYRCPAHNAAVSSTGFDGPHTTGRAVDLAIPNFRLYDFWRIAYRHGFTGHGHGEHRGFCHLDDLTDADGERFAVRPNAWHY